MGTLAWKLRSALSAAGRRRARRLADVVLTPLGSINGSRRPSNAVALTFDDGPDPYVTPKLLDLLLARRSTATFFVLSDSVSRHPDLVIRMVTEGHEVALHADCHRRFTADSVRVARRRMVSAREVIESVSGVPVRLFRPPFGAQTLTTYILARVSGLDVVVWGPFAEDWVDGEPESVAARGLQSLVGGDVVLLHDGLEMPAGERPPAFDRVRMFELVLEGLAARGLRSVTVSELIGTGGIRRTAWFRP